MSPTEIEPEPGFGPLIVSDDGRTHRVTESEARSALGGAGGALVAMIAWDFGAHDWVTLTPHGVPQYIPLLWRESVRWAGLAAGATIFTIAWREQNAPRSDASEPRSDPRELNGRAFVPGRKPGWRE